MAIMIAFMWTALFGMAVIAVDFGYLYTKRRGLQAAADAAVVASMPIYKNTGLTAAQVRARDILRANGYEDGVANTQVQATQPAAGDFQVSIRRTYPTFFGGMLGFGSKSMAGTSKGRVTGGANTAIHANDALGGCDAQYVWGVGVNVAGGGRLLINGDVEARNKVELQSTDVTCTPATCAVTGVAESPCAVFNSSPSTLTIPSTSSAATPDPLAANTLANLNAFCTGGTSVFAAMGGLPWDPEVAGCNPLPTGVYCSSTAINVTPPGPGMSICPSQATFISAVQVQIGGNGAITIAAAPGVPNQIIAFSDFAGAGPAIQLANGPVGNFTLTGSIYAPRGLVNIGTGTPGFTLNGMVVGDTVAIAMGPGQPWVFNGGGGGPGPGWSLVQ